MMVDYMVFHIECFRCSVCKRVIAPRDSYGISEMRELFCYTHYSHSSLAKKVKKKKTEEKTTHGNGDGVSAVGRSVRGSRGESDWSQNESTPFGK